MEKLTVIKIGGNIVDEASVLSAFLKEFAESPSKKILIHGGGKIATRIGDSLGIQSKYIDGRRITDADTIDLVTMVYGGLINKKIVAELQSIGCNAIGLTGADANLLPASKRPIKLVDYGFVGDVIPDLIPVDSWKKLLEIGFVPIVAPLTHDQQGQMLNTNADTIAQEIAKALSRSYEVELIYSFEKAGVLIDTSDDNSVIPVLDKKTYEQLKRDQKIYAGMIPKLDNAFEALNNGVSKVIIGKAENLNRLLSNSSGTTIINE
ncbi:MAG: acetylglutamate kinase [Chitinophagaceae bacterium]|nr:acetylglutamate kinase [Chitinophagaceae bacterium]